MSVDGGKPVGLGPKNNLKTKILGILEGIFTGVPFGHTAGEVEEVSAGRRPTATATMKITPEQANAIRAYIKAQANDPDLTYALAAYNCAQFVEGGLKAAKLPNVPGDAIPIDLVHDLIKAGASPNQ
jgi:hypothetical protein